jgi:hypothetical protein
MNIKSVARSGAVQDAGHPSAYVYGIDREFLPPKSPRHYNDIVIDSPAHLDTLYQYRLIEGWMGEMPVTFTYLMAYRSYEYTKQIFSDYDKRMQVNDGSSWIV